LVKDAFNKAQLLAKDEKLVAEIEKAIEAGDFEKLKELTKTNTAVTGVEKIAAHEYEQARFIGDYLGGGEFNFIPSKQGVEGYLIQNGNEIPVSLKEFVSDKIKNIFRNIRDNSKLVAEESVIDSRIVIGSNPNSVLYAKIINFDKKAVLDFIAASSENVLPSKQIFKQVVFRTNDGSIFSIPLQ
jgi:hypothetical protein